LVDWNKVRTYVVPDMTDFNVSVGGNIRVWIHSAGHSAELTWPDFTL
jgi:hypothetical protein